MREIKFRAWDSEEKVFTDRHIYHHEPSVFHSKYLMISLDGEITCGGMWSSDIQERYELMQYTGLKDKNGKEIYEGDVVECSNPSKPKARIIYKNHQFIGEVNRTSPYTHIKQYRKISWVYITRGIVIGNIYSNPELLEVTEC